MFCSSCGKEISKESKFCNHCGADQKTIETVKEKEPKRVEIVLEEKKEIKKTAVDQCPKCGSERITKYLQYQKNKKVKKSEGCSGCLLFIIILILAPGLVLLCGLAMGASMYALRIPLVIAAVIGIVLSLIVKYHQSDLFICDKCGHKFKSDIIN